MARTLSGKVMSKGTDKTIVVAVQERRRHKLYDKQYFITKRFQVHDEGNRAAKGDTVQITESTPVSRHKRWALHKIVESHKAGTS